MLDKLAALTIIEWLAFVSTAAVMLSLTILLPLKIIKEIKKYKSKE